MNRTRIALQTSLDLDPVPGGMMHSKESAKHGVLNVLEEQIGHYNPLVSVAPMVLQPYPPDQGYTIDRYAFLVYVSLDPLPGGVFTTPDSACAVVEAIMKQRLRHYNPDVKLAPHQYQPANTEGTK